MLRQYLILGDDIIEEYRRFNFGISITSSLEFGEDLQYHVIKLEQDFCAFFDILSIIHE